jgi:hypothetical protein
MQNVTRKALQAVEIVEDNGRVAKRLLLQNMKR